MYITVISKERPLKVCMHFDSMPPQIDSHMPSSQHAKMLCCDGLVIPLLSERKKRVPCEILRGLWSHEVQRVFKKRWWVCLQVGELQGPLKDGWGLTTDGQLLLATDSSSTLYLIDPHTLQVSRKQSSLRVQPISRR